MNLVAMMVVMTAVHWAALRDPRKAVRLEPMRVVNSVACWDVQLVDHLERHWAGLSVSRMVEHLADYLGAPLEQHLAGQKAEN